jgi:hypothetical protein
MTQGLGLFTDKKLNDLRDLYLFAPDYFRALGLVWAYQYMIKLIEKGAREHKEFRRVPAFRTMLVQHFIENWDKHIDVATGQIFSATTVGTIHALKMWQQVGHPMRRTKKNYSARLRAWKAIYDNKNLVVPNKDYEPKSSSHDLFSEADDRNRKRQEKKRFIELGRVKDKEGNIVTYELVIKKRNARFGNATRSEIPFWIVLNYGAGGLQGEYPGYPAIPGVFFVEKAEQQVDFYQLKALEWYERFALEVLTNEKQGAKISDAYRWVKRKRPGVRLNYLSDQYEAARSLAEVF